MARAYQTCGACRNARLDFPFTMAFQPVVDLRERRIVAQEALVRGPNGEGAAAVLAQVNSETRYAFDQACRVKAIEMASALGISCRLNINFLPNAVYEPDACLRTTLKAAVATGFEFNRITFEIVEQEELADTEHLKKIIAAYRSCGFKVALDDFGMGYSGLARFAELRPDKIKVDRALVRDCDTDPVRLAILAGLVKLCRELDVDIVFEGMEREGEVAALRAVGGRFMQGFFFARPAFEAALRDDQINWPARPERAAASRARALAAATQS